MKRFALVVVFAACSSGGTSGAPEPATPDTAAPASKGADVTKVEVSGTAGALQFAVTLSSPDKGCGQYANWWEVLRPDGTLVYRRILGHSHVNEQPFTRSGGPVAVSATDEVIVRAHMHPGGYGGAVFRGTQQRGFERDETIGATFAAAVATAEPQPTGCAF